MIDCGEGTQRQILKSGIGFKRLNRILITHSHLDHILGLAGLVSTLLRWEAMDDLEIFASPGAMNRIHDLLFGVVLRGAKNPPVKLTKIDQGEFFAGEDFSITAFEVPHRRTDSRGFLFDEKGAAHPAGKSRGAGYPNGAMAQEFGQWRGNHSA